MCINFLIISGYLKNTISNWKLIVWNVESEVVFQTQFALKLRAELYASEMKWHESNAVKLKSRTVNSLKSQSLRTCGRPPFPTPFSVNTTLKVTHCGPGPFTGHAGSRPLRLDWACLPVRLTRSKQKLLTLLLLRAGSSLETSHSSSERCFTQFVE